MRRPLHSSEPAMHIAILDAQRRGPSMADWEPLQAQAGIRRRLQRTMRAFWCSSTMLPGAPSEASQVKGDPLKPQDPYQVIGPSEIAELSHPCR
jgi:hypothetical protein